MPPSPASVCSSTPEEFWRNVDYLSQVSTPDVTVSDENGMPQVFRDISSNLSGKTALFFFLLQMFLAHGPILRFWGRIMQFSKNAIKKTFS